MLTYVKKIRFFALLFIGLTTLNSCKLDTIVGAFTPIIEPNYLIGTWGDTPTSGTSKNIWVFGADFKLTLNETDSAGTVKVQSGTYIGGTTNVLNVTFNNIDSVWNLEYETIERIKISRPVSVTNDKGDKITLFQDTTLYYLGANP